MYKLSITTVILTSIINLNTAWADEINSDVYAAPEAAISITDPYASPPQNSDMEEHADVEKTLDEHVMTQNPAPVPVAIDVPKLLREDMATLHLNIIRDHVESTKSGGFSFFSSKSEIDKTLLDDINLFLSVYADLPQAAEALFLKGRVQLKLDMEAAAATSWLQVVYEFPQSDIVFNAEQRLLLLLDEDWDDYADKILPMLGKSISGDRPARLIALINQLYAIEDQDLALALAQLQMTFLRAYPVHTHVDEVQVLLAHNLGVESAESGIFSFKKLIALYPGSAYQAEARLAIGDLQRTRLRAYKDAVSSYQDMIEKHPTHKLTKHAYTNLALTFEEDLRSYTEAIAVLQTIVTLYPEDSVTLSALQTIAKLQEDEEDKPRQAVITLRKLATMFEGSEAVAALEHAIEIAQRDIRDPRLGIEIQEQLIRDFPESDAAPQALLDMAEAYGVNDHPKATSLYRQFLQQYPQHKMASDVRERL